jgi:Type II secretion system (T2SS), protein G
MEEKQTFTTFDTFSVVGLIVGVGMLVFSIVSNAMTSQNSVKAQIETQRLALEIIGGGLQYTNANGDSQSARGPANIVGGNLEGKGRLGLDPWGQPYYFRVFNDNNGKKTVVVYSSGPDQMPDTDETKFTINAEGQLTNARFLGDDIGTVQRSWN